MSELLVNVEAETKQIPLTKTQAEARAFWHAFLHRRGLREVLRCGKCLIADRLDGCKVGITSRHVKVQCRCSTWEFISPLGTSIVPSFANTASVLGDTVRSSLTLTDGTMQTLPALLLTDDEAGVIRLYARVCRDLGWQSYTVHPACWDGSTADDSMMLDECSSDQIKLICKCRMLFYQGLTRTH